MASPKPTSAPGASDASPRRAALLDAATQVLATAGLRGLTHRAVDRQAGFPEGTCSVSFRTRSALLSGVTAHVGAQMAAEVRELGDALPCEVSDPLASLPLTLALLERWVIDDGGAMMIAILELSLESLRSPELVSAVGEWRGELVDIVEGIIARTKQENTRLRAETAVASLEGIVLSALAVPAERRGRYIAETFTMVLVGSAA